MPLLENTNPVNQPSGGETNPGLIVGGANAAGQLINAGAQIYTNNQAQKYGREMYETQRQDNLSQWILQNEYNSPSSQMARLRQAGLNPNLVYGKGADNTASSIPAVSAPAWNPKAPTLDIGGAVSSGLDAYYNYQIKEAQLDNLKTQNTVLTQEAALKAANIASVTTSTAKNQFDLDLASELRTTSADYARENLRKLQGDVQYQMDENERRNIHTGLSVAENAERLLNMRIERSKNSQEILRIKSDIQRIKTSTQLQQLDADLKKNGINPTDPIYQRILGRVLNSAVEGTVYDNVKKHITDWWNK